MEENVEDYVFKNFIGYLDEAIKPLSGKHMEQNLEDYVGS